MSIYQDTPSVRTPKDLERKYDFSLLLKNKKALELQKEFLNKVDALNNNLLNAIIINLQDTIESQSDISLWFFNGVPTLSNNPATEWADDTTKSSHVGDFYYNRETGYTYKFIYSDSTYSWLIIDNNSLIQAMAITNSSIDTSDNQRKVFFSEPVPAYDNGDWWIKEDFTLYICQISKDSAQIYEENDFIIAAKYTDNTLAIKIDNALTVLKGSVTIIENNVDSITQTVRETQSVINSTNTELENYKTTVATQFQQVSDAFNFKFINEILPLIQSGDSLNQEKLNIIEKYIRFVAGDIVLGASDSNFSLKITNEKISFLQVVNEIAYFSNNELYINRAIIAKSLQIGEAIKWEWSVDEEGNLNLGKVTN